MKYLLILALFAIVSLHAEDGFPSEEQLQEYQAPTPKKEESKKEESKEINHPKLLRTVSVIGQGVAPLYAISPAQAYALAKRAALADAYRLLAEKLKGVVVDGRDTIKNMVMQRSTVKIEVAAIIRNATIVETTFKDGLCEVELEVKI